MCGGGVTTWRLVLLFHLLTKQLPLSLPVKIFNLMSTSCNLKVFVWFSCVLVSFWIFLLPVESQPFEFREKAWSCKISLRLNNFFRQLFHILCVWNWYSIETKFQPYHTPIIVSDAFCRILYKRRNFYLKYFFGKIGSLTQGTRSGDPLGAELSWGWGPAKSLWENEIEKWKSKIKKRKSNFFQNRRTTQNTIFSFDHFLLLLLSIITIKILFIKITTSCNIWL